MEKPPPDAAAPFIPGVCAPPKPPPPKLAAGVVAGGIPKAGAGVVDAGGIPKAGAGVVPADGFDPNANPPVGAGVADGCAELPKLNDGVAFAGAGVGAEPNAKDGAVTAGCGAAGCCDPKPLPPNDDAAAVGAAAGACEPNWKAGAADAAGGADAAGTGVLVAVDGGACPKEKAGPGVEAEVSFFSSAGVALGADCPNENAGLLLSFSEGAEVAFVLGWPKENPGVAAGTLSLLFEVEAVAPNEKPGAALPSFFSELALPNANAGVDVVGASSFLLPAPNANVAAGAGAEAVVLLSSAVAPNEKPPLTFAFLPPS